MTVHNLCFHVSCDGFLTTIFNVMDKRANIAVRMRVQVVTPRNRLQVLLFVFVANYLLCCGGIELNPGALGKEADKHTAQDSQEEISTTKGNKGRVDSQTARRLTEKKFVQLVSTDIDQEMGLRIREAFQQQNESFQSLQISINLMRDDTRTVKIVQRPPPQKVKVGRIRSGRRLFPS